MGFFSWTSFVIMLLLVASLWVLLLGYRRVVWGDLDPDPKQERITTVQERRRKAERYTRFLIISVVRRTNVFRVSTRLTFFALFCTFLLVSLFGYVSLLPSTWDKDKAPQESNSFHVVNEINQLNLQEPANRTNRHRPVKRYSGADCPGTMPFPCR